VIHNPASDTTTMSVPKEIKPDGHKKGPEQVRAFVFKALYKLLFIFIYAAST
jgi:hypothetical protein